VQAVALARTALRAEPGTRLAVVGSQRALPAGDFRVDLRFRLPSARPFREKALYAASVSCGVETYVEPILPIVSSMAQVPAVTVTPAVGSTAVAVPRVSQAEVTRTLACPR
jgi:hypothetical protein